MKRIIKLSFMLMVLSSLFTACSKVPAGNVGIKFYLLGGDKGVDYEELSPGRYWIGVNEELYLFPTFTQNYVWTKDPERTSQEDESFNFQDKQGLELNADIGVTYHVDPNKVPQIFETYKRGIDEITDIFLRNMVRDELVDQCSKLDVEYIYGEGRSALMDSVQSAIRRQTGPLGIIVDKLYWIGRIKLPEQVKLAIDAKIKATQDAQKRENEIRTAEAQARIDSIQSAGKGDAVLALAMKEAEANRVLAASITPNLIKYQTVEKWDGILSKVVSEGGVLLSIDE